MPGPPVLAVASVPCMPAPAILLWMHKGLGYIYGQSRVKRNEPARKAEPAGWPQKEANMSIEQFIDN